PAPCPRKPRQEQDRTEQAKPDQKIARQQHEADGLGQGEKQERSREKSGTASYAAAATIKRPLMTHHHLHSSPETCHWGFFEAKLKPVLTIKSGDEVAVDTVSGGPDVLPDKSEFHIPPELF